MTNLQNHCTDYEMSQKLKEVGVTQISEFYWVDFEDDEHDPKKWTSLIYVNNALSTFIHYRKYSAFLLSELIEILGDKFVRLELDYQFKKSDPEFYYTATGSDVVALPYTEMRDITNITPIQAVSNLILKLHEGGILIFNQKLQ